MTATIPDNFGCVGTTIKLANGLYIDLASPDPALIDIRTIASALSKICRFGGHCPKFYSVAEHCTHAAKMAYMDALPNAAVRAILLHDAAEAFIGDMVKPLKLLLPSYGDIESRFEQAIAERFGVRFDSWCDEIKHYDRQMLKCEKTRLWPEDAEKWSGFGNLPDREVNLKFFEPESAFAFFTAFSEWMGLCQLPAVGASS